MIKDDCKSCKLFYMFWKSCDQSSLFEKIFWTKSLVLYPQTETLAEDCKQSNNVNDISNYYEKVASVIGEKKITDLNFWNMDEIGFLD